ncbi:MAG: 2-succinyl-6-hydroxy-2,4-cyclohexadiene-1-carboxylate synthase [Candidatus Zixiibacteriota bacterium]
MMQTIRTADVEWSYRRTGRDDAPTIVLLHGFTGCAEVWQDIADALSETHHCVIPDLPGHGNTVGPTAPEECTLDRAAGRLSQFCDELGLRGVAVWGYSMGGRLALQWALLDPGRISALILESASPGIAEPGEREARRLADNQLADRIASIGVAAFAEEWMANPLFASQKELPEERRHLGRRLREKNTAAGLALSLRGMGTGVQTPLHDRLPHLSMPVLVLAGARDAKFCGIGDAMSGVIPRASFRIVSGAGHAVSWERPQTCVDIVRSFLERIEPPK